MKAKIIFKQILVLFVVILISVTIGCKKEEPADEQAVTGSLQQLSRDEAMFNQAVGDLLSDEDKILTNTTSKSVNADSLPCNVVVETIFDTTTYGISVTFNGLNCEGTYERVGNITFTSQYMILWNQKNAKVNVTYNNLKITHVATGKYIILNGEKTFENVSGGFLFQIPLGLGSIVHKAYGNFEITFDDNTKRTWNLARQRTYTGGLFGQYLITDEGFGSEGNLDNLEVWGTNRQNELFYTQISTPVVFKQACYWAPVSGVKSHQIPSKQIVAAVTFGYDDNNLPVSGTNCPTRYRLDWQNGANSGTLYLPLH